LHSAFRLAKAVRTHTDINTGALSIAQAAVELAAVNFNIADAKILIIGSGSNAELIARHLIRKSAEDITIVARNKDAAEQLIARNQTGRFLPLSELDNQLSCADVVFTAASSQKPLITAVNLKSCHKPLILIDLSVPANIEKEAEYIEGIKLFNIDSLNAIININNRRRRGQIPKAKTLIAERLQTFAGWLENSKAPA
jgi:glutamyl-tRNA reductase